MTTEILQIIIVNTCMNNCVGSLTKVRMFVPLRAYSGVIFFSLSVLLFPQTVISYFFKVLI